jgi:hypothetical protein
MREATCCCSSGLFEDQIELCSLYDASPKIGNVSLPAVFIERLVPPKLGDAGVPDSASAGKASSYQMD